MKKHTIDPAVLNINQLQLYLGLSKNKAQEFGEDAGALVHLSEKRIGYLKSRIDNELERRLEVNA